MEGPMGSLAPEHRSSSGPLGLSSAEAESLQPSPGQAGFLPGGCCHVC